jgi:hypothetical protein
MDLINARKMERIKILCIILGFPFLCNLHLKLCPCDILMLWTLLPTFRLNMLPTVSGLKTEVPSKLWDSIPGYMTSHQNLFQSQPGRKRKLTLANILNGPEYLEVRGLKIQVRVCEMECACNEKRLVSCGYVVGRFRRTFFSAVILLSSMTVKSLCKQISKDHITESYSVMNADIYIYTHTHTHTH